MKIAFLLRHFPALSETFVLNQITGLLDRGHDVEIFAESSRDELLHPQIEHHGLLHRTAYWPAMPERQALRWLKGLGLVAGLAVKHPSAAAVALNVRAYGRLALTANLGYAGWPLGGGRRYDIIQCHFGTNGILGMALQDMGLVQGKLVTAFHGFDLSQELQRRGRDVYTRLFRRGDLFLPISERWRRRLVELGCEPAKIAVHHMGIDCERFRLRLRYPDPGGVIRFVSVARLIEKKGIEYAIRAVAVLAGAGKRIEYTIIGDGPMAGDLERLIVKLGVSDIVSLAGKRSQPEVIRILDDAHGVLVPSVVARNGDEEGIPTVIMEAMAMGLPVIATRHSGIPELVEDGVSGMLVEERNVGALVRAIGELADHPARWPAFGHAGRQRVLARHNINTLNDTLVTLYQRLIASPPGT